MKIRRRKPINRPEQALQRACVGLLERFYEPMPDVFWTAINPVPAKSKAVAGISKAMGLKPGTFDLIFIRRPLTGFHCMVLFAEAKAPGEGLSKSQVALKPQVERTNAWVRVFDTLEQFVQILAEFGIHPKRKFTLRQSADEYLTNHL